MASKKSEAQAVHAHEMPELVAKPNGSTAASIMPSLNGSGEPNVSPKSRTLKAKPVNNVPKDCPIIKQQIPLAGYQSKPLTSTSWFWPLLFSAFLAVFAAGIAWGHLFGQDTELKANNAALSARIEAVAADRNRDSERLARLEVVVQSIDKNLQSLIDNSRPAKSRP